MSWFDLVVTVWRPEELSSLRSRNGLLRAAYLAEPYFATRFDPATFPWADTLWSLNRLQQLYAAKNNWYLRDLQGRTIEFPDGILLNWTIGCPRGVYGTARGLRAAEWYARIAVPWICASGRYWPTWAWDDLRTINALMIEVGADCICGAWGGGSQNLLQANPIPGSPAEPCFKLACSGSGNLALLPRLMADENARFFAWVKVTCPSLPILLQAASDYMGPTWREQVDGWKLEMWMRDGRSWWDWWYGGPIHTGYQYTAPRLPFGWSRTLLCVYRDYRLDLGFGTALLGDGYLVYTHDQHRPLWPAEFNIRLGTPRRPPRKYVVGQDTLYTRTFTGEHGEGASVVVNPYDHPVWSWQPGTTIR